MFTVVTHMRILSHQRCRLLEPKQSIAVLLRLRVRNKNSGIGEKLESVRKHSRKEGARQKRWARILCRNFLQIFGWDIGYIYKYKVRVVYKYKRLAREKMLQIRK